MDPITLTTAINLLLIITKAMGAGIDISVRVESLITTARAEGRDISQAELDGLQSETDRLREERKEKLAEAVTKQLDIDAAAVRDR